MSQGCRPSWQLGITKPQNTGCYTSSRRPHLNLLIAAGGSIIKDVWEEGDYTSTGLDIVHACGEWIFIGSSLNVRIFITRGRGYTSVPRNGRASLHRSGAVPPSPRFDHRPQKRKRSLKSGAVGCTEDLALIKSKDSVSLPLAQ